MNDELHGPTSPNVTIALCRGRLQAMGERLEQFGGTDLLGYALSHSLMNDDCMALNLFADCLRDYAAAKKQLKEALRIAKWNADQERAP